MSKSIESGCRPETFIIDDGKMHQITYDISHRAKEIMEEIMQQQDKWVFEHLPKEILLKLQEKITMELHRRYEENINA